MAIYLKWDSDTERLYETGVRRGVLYPWDNDTNWYGEGVAWNGLSSVTESPSGAESNPVYADDRKYLDIRSAEEFGATIEAYTYPEEWLECDGYTNLNGVSGVTIGQQARKKFALCYRTVVGNDTEYSKYGYKLHLIYGCTASPSEKQYETQNDSPEPTALSWEIATEPISVDEDRTTSIITIDSTKITAEAKPKLVELENMLYGTAAGASGTPAETKPKIPTIAELIEMFPAS